MILQEKKHYLDLLPFEQNLVIRYSHESSLGPIVNCRCKQSVIGSIVLMDDTDQSEKEIGRLLLSLGTENGWDSPTVIKRDNTVRRP